MPLRWKDRMVIHLRAEPRGSQDIQDGSELEALHTAAEIWNRAIEGCAYIRFHVKAPMYSVWATDDDEVAVQWISDWINRTGRPCHMSAVTEIWVVNAAGELDDGAIVDANILLNDQYYTFTTSGEAHRLDVLSTMVHELGHVLGLDHPCLASSMVEPPQPEDHLGRHLPLCTVASDEIRRSVMYPTTRGGLTGRSEPTADDVAGVCASYTLHEEPWSLEATPIIGCSLTGGPIAREATWPWPVPTILIALTILCLLNRRRAHA